MKNITLAKIYYIIMACIQYILLNIFADTNFLLINRSLDIYSRYIKSNFKNTNFVLSIIGLLTLNISIMNLI